MVVEDLLERKEFKDFKEQMVFRVYRVYREYKAQMVLVLRVYKAFRVKLAFKVPVVSEEQMQLVKLEQLAFKDRVEYREYRELEV
jgi:hypothetical protein